MKRTDLQRIEDMDFIRNQLIDTHDHNLTALLATFDTTERGIIFLEAHQKDVANNLKRMRDKLAAKTKTPDKNTDLAMKVSLELADIINSFGDEDKRLALFKALRNDIDKGIDQIVTAQAKEEESDATNK